MKQMLRKKDVWVLLAALIGAFACVTLIQFISGRIDGVASMVFLLAVFFVSMYTDGYWWGVAGSVISVLAVNFAFRTPYFAFNFTIPENIFSGVVMLVVSFMTSTLTTRIKKQEQLRMESETEKMRANLLRAVFPRPVPTPSGSTGWWKICSPSPASTPTASPSRRRPPCWKSWWIRCWCGSRSSTPAYRWK